MSRHRAGRRWPSQLGLGCLIVAVYAVFVAACTWWTVRLLPL